LYENKDLNLKKIKRLIYMRNINGIFNKKKPIENTIEISIYYQKNKEKIEINVIRGQK